MSKKYGIFHFEVCLSFSWNQNCCYKVFVWKKLIGGQQDRTRCRADLREDNLILPPYRQAAQFKKLTNSSLRIILFHSDQFLEKLLILWYYFSCWSCWNKHGFYLLKSSRKRDFRANLMNFWIFKQEKLSKRHKKLTKMILLTFTGVQHLVRLFKVVLKALNKIFPTDSRNRWIMVLLPSKRWKLSS